MTKKSIAIIGAGFAGLALAYHLIDSHSVTVFHEKRIGKGASGISAGLLHPYAGAKARNNWRGQEGMQATLPLLEAAQKETSKLVYRKEGILRLAINEAQEENFQSCSKRNPDVLFFTKEEVQEIVPGVANRSGILIESGITVYPEHYLLGLQSYLDKRGVKWVEEKVSSLNQLSKFTLAIVAAGAGLFSIQGVPDLKLTRLKGQILTVPWPESEPPLPITLNSEIYMVMSPDQKTCSVGSTFERHFNHNDVDKEVVNSYILPKLYALYPALKDIKPIDYRAGIRIAAPGHLPLIKKISSNCFVLTGLGSKGLLYHSLIAEELAKLVV